MSEFLSFSGDYVGLSDEETEERLGLYGYNTENKSESGGRSFSIVGVFLSLRFFLMLGAGALMILGGDMLGGIILLLLTVVHSFLQIYVGFRSEDALAELGSKSDIRCRVIRNGEIIMLSKEYIVPDDIIILQSGENVPVDAYLLEIKDLLVDESLFTGDKTPAAKIIGTDTKNEIKQSCIYKGTRIVSGSLVARVSATGVDTRAFKTLGQKDAVEESVTAFEGAIKKALPIFSIAALLMLILGAVMSFIKIPTVETTILDLVCKSVIPAVAFALCFIPGDILQIIRYYYLNSARKLMKRRCTVKDLSALEALNALTVVCIDKAGTITKNRLEVSDEYTKSPEMLNNIAVLASDTVCKSRHDQAIILNAAFKHIDVKSLTQNELIKDYPLTPTFKVGGKLWRINGSRLLCVKGSAENVLTLCDMESEKLYAVQRQISSYASEGKHTLAVAYATLDENDTPTALTDVHYRYVGLIAFLNQTRDTIPVAVHNCYKAGVRVVMTTDDNTETAAAIAKKIGVRQGDIVTGEQLKEASEEGRKLDVSKVSVFARILPEQKKDIVRLLRESGEIVALMGGEDSDPNAFEASDVGILMSESTIGAVYEASGVVMADDSFNDFVDVMKESRQTHKNIKRSLGLVISSVLGFGIFALINLLLGRELFFGPIFSALVTLFLVPFASLLFLDNSSDVKSELFSSGYIGRGKINKSFFIDAVVDGATLLLFSLLNFYLLYDLTPAQLCSSFLLLLTAALVTLALTHQSDSRLLYTAFSGHSGKGALFGGLLLVAAVALVYIPYLNSIFGFETINPLVALISVVFGVLSEAWREVAKLIKSGSKSKSDNQ